MPFSVVAMWIWAESLLYFGGEDLLLWCKKSAGSLLNQMLMCTVICKVGFPAGKGVPEARGRSGCQLPETDTQGAAMSGNCWISITGLVCAAGSCCEVAARGNPHSLLWLSRGWSWQICHWAPSGAEFSVNTPWPCFRQIFKYMLGAWEDGLCFSGR